MYTPWPVPAGTRESKTTMLTWGRALMLRECVTSGDEIQKNSRYRSAAKKTGETQGCPSSSAVPSVM